MTAARAVGLPGGAVHNGCSIHRLGQSARAVGDCQRGRLHQCSSQFPSTVELGIFKMESDGVAYLRHGVDLGAVGDGGGPWAEGGIGCHDLGGVADMVIGDIAIGCIHAGHEGSGSNDGGRRAHFDGIN